MDGMPRPRPPFVQREVTRHGRVVWYVRRDGGPRIRLPDKYGSDAFWQAYHEALQGHVERQKEGAKKTAHGTLEWVVQRYRESADYSSLAPSTQRVRDRLLQRIVAKSGNMPVRLITKRHIEDGRDRRADRPGAANNWLKTMKVLLRHAVRLDLIDHNPADAVYLLPTSRDGWHTWTIDEVAAYEARHPIGTKARLAMDLMLYTGLRRSDIVRIGHQHIRNGILSIRPLKTSRTSGVTVTLRVLPALAESIAATKTGDLCLLVTEYNKPFTAAGFGNWFRDRCREAGVPGSAHGLRKAAATRAAEAGATTHELMAMFGWTSEKEAERYTRAADRKRLGLQASGKLADSTEGKGAGGA